MTTKTTEAGRTATRQPKSPGSALTGGGSGLTLDVFRAGPKRLGVFASGATACGTVHHLMGGLNDYTVVSGLGERLKCVQGTCFEMKLEMELDEPLSDEDFLLLQKRLLARLQGFVLPEELPRDLYAWVEVEAPRDAKELLPSFAAVCANNRVSLSSFRFDRLQWGEAAVHTKLTARLELPVGLDELFLERELRQHLPADVHMSPLDVSKDSPRYKETSAPGKAPRRNTLRN
jgi:hypothetical protein